MRPVLRYLKGDGKIWIGLAVAAVALYLIAPALLTPFRLSLLAKYLCWAMVAVGVGLAWGKGGMLVLGQGVFFGLGGYIMAMHLKLTDAGPGQAPDFMVLYGNGVVPAWWEPFRSPVVTLVCIVLVPAGVAALLGVAIFRRRVKGAYFAILSQALAAAFAILLIGQQTTTGGTNGLNGFRGFFGYNLFDPLNKQLLFSIAVTVLLIMVVVVWHLYRSRFGELLVAVRDQEERVRFLGYNPANIKLVAYVVAAAMAGIAGALFVPIVGIISPADVGVLPSIAFIIGVAIGGRATLVGPVLGAIVVAYAQTTLSERFPGFWIYFQGALFMLVVAFLPGGIASIASVVKRARATRPEPPPAAVDLGGSSTSSDHPAPEQVEGPLGSEKARI
jgi:urea transport system permease protein